MNEQTEMLQGFTPESDRCPVIKRESGQSHILEIIVGVLIVVVLGIFLYTTGVPAIEALWNGAMSTIGTIEP